MLKVRNLENEKKSLESLRKDFLLTKKNTIDDLNNLGYQNGEIIERYNFLKESKIIKDYTQLVEEYNSNCSCLKELDKEDVNLAMTNLNIYTYEQKSDDKTYIALKRKVKEQKEEIDELIKNKEVIEFEKAKDIVSSKQFKKELKKVNFIDSRIATIEKHIDALNEKIAKKSSR